MRTYATSVMIALAVGGCAPVPKAVNFGNLQLDQRPFDFHHSISLFEVKNGMRVALIPDPSTNLATFDLRYDVGAAEDPAGRTGMAHLVEHLAFEYRATPGGPTINDELEELTLYHNAETSWDYTHFTETALIQNLGKLIVLEGRRMKAPCDQLDDATFRREIGVVLQEERQRYLPLMKTMLALVGEVYGADHPYARPLSSDEVTAATREEFCSFVEHHYTPDRAYLVVTGNFDPDQMSALIGKTFGPVTRKAGPRRAAPAAHFDGKVTRHNAAVDNPTAVVFLPYPAWGGDNIVLWDVVRSQLATGLAEADDKYPWLTGTAVFPWMVERARVLAVVVEVNTDAYLERAVDEVFERAQAINTDLTPEQVRRLVAAKSLDYIQTWDTREGRGQWISMFMQYTLHDWFMLKELQALHTTRYDVALPAITSKLTRANSHVGYLIPAGDAKAEVAGAVPSTTHQLTPWRPPVDAAEADRPVALGAGIPPRPVTEFDLSNGMHVVLAPEVDSQIVDARVVFPVGSAHEPADRPYLATAAASMLGFDYDRTYPIRVANTLSGVMEKDTVLDVDVDETSTTFICRGSATWGDWHVWLLNWWVDQGVYNRKTLRATRRMAEGLAASERTADEDPVARAMLDRLYGAGHPYASPQPRGAALLQIGAGDLSRWKADHFRPRGATLVVSGGFDARKMRDEIKELFGEWSDESPTALPAIAPTRPADHPSWFAVTAPSALQTRVVIDIPTASDRLRDEAARYVLVAMLDDQLRDLREGMGATYGVSVRYYGGPAGGFLEITALLDEARAPEATERMLAVVDGLGRDAAGQRESFVRARKKVLGQSLARTGGATAVANELEGAFEQGHGTGHATELATSLATLTPAKLGAVAAADLSPARRVVMVRGKQPVLDLVYQRLAVTPEILKDADEVVATGEDPDEEDEPPARPIVDNTQPTRTADELFLGSEHARAGQKDGKYYLGDQEISLDRLLDLAGATGVKQRMHRRRWIKRGLFAGGLGGIVGGGAYALTAGGCDDGSFVTQADQDACTDASTRRKTVGTVVAAIGLGLVITNLQLGDGRPSEDDLLDLANAYNRRSIGLAPVATPGGAQLLLTGTF